MVSTPVLKVPFKSYQSSSMSSTRSLCKSKQSYAHSRELPDSCIHIYIDTHQIPY
jgi:hypothetical protein